MPTPPRYLRTVLLIFSVLMVLAFGPGLWTQVRMTWRQRMLDRQLQALRVRKEMLEHEKARLTSDSIYLEGKVRSTFKLAKPGELVVPLEHDKTSR